MYTLLLTSILACGNKEEDSGLIHISNDGPTGDAFSTPTCGPQQMDSAIRFVVGLESVNECPGTMTTDFAVIITLSENTTIESDVPVSLTTESGLFYTGEGDIQSPWTEKLPLHLTGMECRD